MKKMLMIVDLQVDFITGSLPVPGAAEAMDALVDYIDEHGSDYAIIAVTRDWHPTDHCSFATSGGQWPEHCVAGTKGAQIYPTLENALNKREYTVLNKGKDREKEEYSIFANPEAREELDKVIRDKGIEGIDICGLAGDICVAQSMSDGRKIYGEDFFNLLPEYSPTIG